MPNPITNFRDSFGTDLGNKLITKEYLMTVYPQISNQLITPELWTWGRGSEGQLGNNAVTTRSTPITTFAGGTNWKQASSSRSYFSAAIKNDGTLWAWGRNDYGGIGDNTSGTNRSTPVTTFAGGTNWKQVSTGSFSIAAIKTDGTLWVWGGNGSIPQNGILGDNVTTGNGKSTPITTFAGGTNWKQVSNGGSHIGAIKTDGTLWLWGDNYRGVLGINASFGTKYTPITTFAGGNNWKQVSCSGYHTAAIKTDGTLWTWGRNNLGQLGDNTATQKNTPVTTFAGGTNWKQVSCGGNAMAAIKTDGTLWTWGANTYGQLGDNTLTSRSTPVTTFAGGTNWKQVDCNGGYTTAAIKTDGTLWVWGGDLTYGLLGINAPGNRSTPVTTFAGGTNWKQVSSGYNMMAIKTSDDLQGI